VARIPGKTVRYVDECMSTPDETLPFIETRARTQKCFDTAVNVFSSGTPFA
jgi:hypothetical protein